MGPAGPSSGDVTRGALWLTSFVAGDQPRRLGTSAGVPAGGATLAELYALREGHEPAVEHEPVLSGQYL
jgi:hypothetical protein